MKIVCYLADAAITLAFFVATVAGADLRFILSAILLMTFLGELAKAFNAFAVPVKDALEHAIKLIRAGSAASG